MAGVIPIVVDLYQGDNVTDFTKASAAGVKGIIHKATTGATGRDSKYKARRQAALKAGLLWGAYHWGTHIDVSRQVKNFLDWATPDANTLVALDFEKTSGNQMTLDQARQFLQELGGKIGRKPVIYSGDTLKTALGNKKDAFFGGHRLWLAQYGPHAVVQASWKSYWLWQYSGGKPEAGDPNQNVPGLPGNDKGELDRNRYSGSPAQLAKDWAS